MPKNFCVYVWVRTHFEHSCMVVLYCIMLACKIQRCWKIVAVMLWIRGLPEGVELACTWVITFVHSLAIPATCQTPSWVRPCVPCTSLQSIFSDGRLVDRPTYSWKLHRFARTAARRRATTSAWPDTTIPIGSTKQGARYRGLTHRQASCNS